MASRTELGVDRAYAWDDPEITACDVIAERACYFHAGDLYGSLELRG